MQRTSLLMTTLGLVMAKETGKAHIKIFGQAFGAIVVSEIGDKTFFLAAIMSMKYNRVAVFIGAASALVLMTILSCAFGMVVPNLIPQKYTLILVTILFFFFSGKLFWDWHHMEVQLVNQELEEVEQEMQHLDKKLMNLPDQENDQVKNDAQQNFIQVQVRHIMWQAFILTFLGEWGDRSQITTIGLAAAQDADIVCLGASIGHLLCTAIAVAGGKLLANKISEKTVNLAGAITFLVFGLISLYEIFQI